MGENNKGEFGKASEQIQILVKRYQTPAPSNATVPVHV